MEFREIKVIFKFEETAKYSLVRISELIDKMDLSW